MDEFEFGKACGTCGELEDHEIWCMHSPDYCAQCNYVDHKCGGCGTDVAHGYYTCGPCGVIYSQAQ